MLFWKHLCIEKYLVTHTTQNTSPKTWQTQKHGKSTLQYDVQIVQNKIITFPIQTRNDI